MEIKQNGTVEMMGIDVNIASVLGEKVVDQVLAKLTSEEIDAITNFIKEKLFENRTYFNDDGPVKKLCVKQSNKNGIGHHETSIGEIIEGIFYKRASEILSKKVEEIILSDEYQKKIDEIANELVEYSVNGYKEDMKHRIRERLVGNILNDAPSYAGDDLICIINKVIDERMRY